MATSLDATVGASTSNSYVTLAAAKSYFDNHPDETTWDALADADMEKYLMQATTLIDTENIDGDKYTTTMTSGVPDQALRFPRSCDYDDGSKYIPAEVKKACYEQALQLAKTGTTATRLTLQAQGVKSVSTGDGWSETYGDTVSGGTQLSTKARSILVGAGLIKMGASWYP